MADFDLKTAIGSFAPTLAAMLCGPLAGGAVKALVGAFGLSSTSSQTNDLSAITTMVQNGQVTPEMIAAARVADQKHAEILSQQGIDLVKLNNDHAQAMAAIDLQRDSLSIDDVKSARDHGRDNPQIWYLAWFITGIFAVTMLIVIVGCYYLITTAAVINQTLAMAISGLVGGVVGYVAANMQTVVNFVYGGSIGSRNNAAALAASAKQTLDQLSMQTTVAPVPKPATDDVNG